MIYTVFVFGVIGIVAFVGFQFLYEVEKYFLAEEQPKPIKKPKAQPPAAILEALTAAQAFFRSEDMPDRLFDEAALKVDRACELLGIQGGEE